MPPTYQDFVNLIQDGTPVNAATTNVPISQLAGRDDALKALIDALSAGQSLLVPDCTLDPNLPVGSPVYLGSDNIYHLAATALADDVAGGVVAATSFVTGIIFSRSGTTTGTIALGGRVTGIATATWAAIIDTATFAAGQYWLSSTTPGILSLDPGPLAIRIGQLDSAGNMLIQLNTPNYGAHSHYKFKLLGDPAGTVVDPGTGDPQTVNTPNAAVEGWLPASSPYFNPAWIPAGASFGYNLSVSAATALAACLPPLPNSSVFGCQGGRAIPSTQLVCNDFGIWWIGNAYGTAPWPVNYVASGDVAQPIDFFFVQLQAATDTAIVTSLGVTNDTVLDATFVDASGNPATGGKLFLRVPAILTSTSTVDDGALAVKSVTGGNMTTGPVIAHLVQGAGVTLSSTNEDDTGFFGDVTISASAADALQGSADLCQLNNAAMAFIQSVPMANMRAGINVAPVFSIDVSPLAPATNSLVLQLWLYSSAGGNIPSGLTISYRIVPAPTVLTTVPTGWTSLSWTMTAIALGAGQSQVVTSPTPIPAVPQGSLVLIQITRAGSTDGFAGDIGVIRVSYALQ